MERIQIVKDALEGEYDEFYDDYVSGKRNSLKSTGNTASSLPVQERKIDGNEGRRSHIASEWKRNPYP